MPAYSHARDSRTAGGIEHSTAIIQDEIVTFTSSQTGKTVVNLAVEHSGPMCVIVLLHSCAVENCHFFGWS